MLAKSFSPSLHANGKYVVRHFPAISVGFIAHPSFVEESELQSFKGPLSLAAAETDHIFPHENRHAAERTLAASGQPWQVALYSHVEHGFGLRADVSKRAARFAKERAFAQAVSWFDEWLLVENDNENEGHHDNA
jgi:dienelactone hydrolase